MTLGTVLTVSFFHFYLGKFEQLVDFVLLKACSDNNYHSGSFSLCLSYLTFARYVVEFEPAAFSIFYDALSSEDFTALIEAVNDFLKLCSGVLVACMYPDFVEYLISIVSVVVMVVMVMMMVVVMFVFVVVIVIIVVVMMVMMFMLVVVIIVIVVVMVVMMFMFIIIVIVIIVVVMVVVMAFTLLIVTLVLVLMSCKLFICFFSQLVELCTQSLL